VETEAARWIRGDGGSKVDPWRRRQQGGSVETEAARWISGDRGGKVGKHYSFIASCVCSKRLTYNTDQAFLCL